MFSGSLVAIVTPMDEQRNVDRGSFKRLIEYHINSGTHGIVVVGTSGESATLDHKEHCDTIKLAIDLAEGRIPLIAGTGSNATSEAISLTRDVERLDLAGCLTVTPYYNKPPQEGLYQHFKAIAENTDLPQILYNVPGRTSCDMDIDTVARLAEISNIVAIKEATGDLSRVKRLRSVVGNDFSLLSGDDATFLDFMQLGGNGNISVTANIAAKQMAQICELAMQGRFEDAQVIQNNLMPLHKTMFVESNPIPVKWACKRLGLIDTDFLRLPLVPLTLASQRSVEQALFQTGLL